MIDFGTVTPGRTLYIYFDSFAGATGASSAMTGLAVTDIEVFKDGSTTQRASDNGYTLLDTDGLDFDGITGINGFSISLADNSTAGFWAAGSDYVVVVSSVTVDSQTVNFVAARFRIGYAGSILDTTIATLASQTSFTLTAGPAEDDALNGREIIIHDVASAVQLGSAIILDYTGSTKTVTLAAGTTFTAATTDNVVVMGYAPLMPTVQGRTILVGTAGQADANVTQFGSTNGTFSAGRPEVNTTHAAGTAWGSGAITAASIATGAIDADALATDAVNEIRNAITGGAYALSTDASGMIRIVDGTGTGELDTTSGGVLVAALAANSITAASAAADFGTEVGTAVWASATRVLTAGTNLGTVSANVTQWLSTAVTLDGASNLPNVQASLGEGGGEQGLNLLGLEYVANGFGAVADVVWDEDTVLHTTAGSFGKAASDALADTNELQTDWANGGRLDNILDARASQTSVDTIDDFLDTEIALILTRIGVPGTSLAGDIAALNDITAPEVWAAGTRTLTAGTNIVLAKGTGVTGFSDITAADVWTRVLENGNTAEELMRGIAAFAMGKASGGNTTAPTFRDLADTKNRIAMTADANGNRTAVARNLT